MSHGICFAGMVHHPALIRIVDLGDLRNKRIRRAGRNTAKVFKSLLGVRCKLVEILFRNLNKMAVLHADLICDGRINHPLTLHVIPERITLPIYDVLFPSETFPDRHANCDRAGVFYVLIVNTRRKAELTLHLSNNNQQALMAFARRIGMIDVSRLNAVLDGLHTNLRVIFFLDYPMRVRLVKNSTENVVTLECSFSRVSGNDPDIFRKSNLLRVLRIARIVLVEPRRIFDARVDITEDNFASLLFAGTHLHESDTRTGKQIVITLRVLQTQNPMRHIRQRNGGKSCVMSHDEVSRHVQVILSINSNTNSIALVKLLNVNNTTRVHTLSAPTLLRVSIQLRESIERPLWKNYMRRVVEVSPTLDSLFPGNDPRVSTERPSKMNNIF